MRLLREIQTPWAPYTVAFSRDGGRLAIGGGTFYGTGGIVLVSVSDGQSESFEFSELPEYPDRHNTWPTVSGICWAADDRHLVAIRRTCSRFHLVVE